MSSNSSNSTTSDEFDVLFSVRLEEEESSEDPPPSEWASLEVIINKINPKKLLHEQNLYDPGSEEICNKYIAQSDSQVLSHPLFAYPGLTDPGIEDALLKEIPKETYSDDGVAYYKSLCKEMDICPVRLFYSKLTSTDINLNYYGVRASGIQAMAKALTFNRTVTSFNLTDNFLTIDGCFHLSEMLVLNYTLKKIILAGCRIGSKGMMNLRSGFQMNRGLNEVDLSRNLLEDEGGVELVKCLIEGFAVSKLNLSSNNLGDKTALFIAQELEYINLHFTHLDLSWNNFFKQKSTAKMLDRLANIIELKELNLAWNSMEGEKIATSISTIMMECSNLEVLDLNNNKFRDVEVIKILVSKLNMAKKLHTLNLSFNPLSPIEAYIVLEKMLVRRVKVKNLLLDNICVNKSFLKCLEKVRNMESRKDFHVVYGVVLKNWTTGGVDSKELVLRRAQYLGGANKKRRVDVPLYFLQLIKDNPSPMIVKDFVDKVNGETPLDLDLLTEMAYSFPSVIKGRKKTPAVDLKMLLEYILRLFPGKHLPKTPPPESLPESTKEPINEKTKIKGKN